MEHKVLRALAQVVLFTLGALFVLAGIHGRVIHVGNSRYGMPAQYGGYVLIALGIVGLFANVWYGARTAPSTDRTELDEYESAYETFDERHRSVGEQPDLLRVVAMERDTEARASGPNVVAVAPADRQRPAA